MSFQKGESEMIDSLHRETFHYKFDVLNARQGILICLNGSNSAKSYAESSFTALAITREI